MPDITKYHVRKLPRSVRRRDRFWRKDQSGTAPASSSSSSRPTRTESLDTPQDPAAGSGQSPCDREPASDADGFAGGFLGYATPRAGGFRFARDVRKINRVTDCFGPVGGAAAPRKITEIALHANNEPAQNIGVAPMTGATSRSEAGIMARDKCNVCDGTGCCSTCEGRGTMPAPFSASHCSRAVNSQGLRYASPYSSSWGCGRHLTRETVVHVCAA